MTEYLVKLKDYPLNRPVCSESARLPDELQTAIFKLIQAHMKTTDAVAYTVKLSVEASVPVVVKETT